VLVLLLLVVVVAGLAYRRKVRAQASAKLNASTDKGVVDNPTFMIATADVRANVNVGTTVPAEPEYAEALWTPTPTANQKFVFGKSVSGHDYATSSASIPTVPVGYDVVSPPEAGIDYRGAAIHPPQPGMDYHNSAICPPQPGMDYRGAAAPPTGAGVTSFLLQPAPTGTKAAAATKAGGHTTASEHTYYEAPPPVGLAGSSSTKKTAMLDEERYVACPVGTQATVAGGARPESAGPGACANSGPGHTAAATGMERRADSWAPAEYAMFDRPSVYGPARSAAKSDYSILNHEGDGVRALMTTSPPATGIGIDYAAVSQPRPSAALVSTSPTLAEYDTVEPAKGGGRPIVLATGTALTTVAKRTIRLGPEPSSASGARPEPDRRCIYMNDRGKQCKIISAAGSLSQHCARHLCPVCGGEKGSRETQCNPCMYTSLDDPDGMC
jgi:hypothetical protein